MRSNDIVSRNPVYSNFFSYFSKLLRMNVKILQPVILWSLGQFKIIVCFLLGTMSLSLGAEGAIFLNITPGSKAVGLSQAFVALADDASACYYNPAGLAFINQPRVLSMNLSPPVGLAKASLWSIVELSHPIFGQKMHSSIDPGFVYGRFIYSAFTLPVDNRSSIGVAMDYFNYGPNSILDPLYYFYDYALSLSYGRKITGNLSFGLSSKYIYEFLFPQWLLDSLDLHVPSSLRTFAFDAGFLFKCPAGFSFGSSLLNLGPPEKFDTTSYELPLTGLVGIGQSVTDFFKWIGKDENYSEFQVFNRLPIDFRVTVEHKFDLAGEMRYDNTMWGIEVALFKSFFYRQGFGITEEENPLYTNPKSLGLNLGIVEFDIALTSSNHPAARWWIQSEFKPLERKPQYLEEHRVLDRIMLNLSCLSMPGGGQLYNGDKWRGAIFVAVGFLAADAILERETRPDWQSRAATISLPILYLISGLEANVAAGKR